MPFGGTGEQRAGRQAGTRFCPSAAVRRTAVFRTLNRIRDRETLRSRMHPLLFSHRKLNSRKLFMAAFFRAVPTKTSIKGSASIAAPSTTHKNAPRAVCLPVCLSVCLSSGPTAGFTLHSLCLQISVRVARRRRIGTIRSS